jgi:hypothetical protein
MVKTGATLIFGHCAVALPGVMLCTKLPSYVPSKAVVVLVGDPGAGAAATAGGGGGWGAQAETARSEIANKNNRSIHFLPLIAEPIHQAGDRSGYLCN